MAARTKSYVTPKYKTKYKVRNWPAYEASLRKRGDVTVWFDEACENRRRRWRKLHLGLDAQGFVVASAVTDSGQDDATEGVRMYGLGMPDSKPVVA